MPKIYGIKTCDTCRKAVKIMAVDLYDIRANPLSRDQLQRFFDAFGEALVNRRSTTWRNLDEAARQGDPIDLLLEYPTLMKRPVIDVDGTLYLGFGKQVQAKFMAN